MSQVFAWGGQSTGVSALASFLPKKSQGWPPSEWIGWISLQSNANQNDEEVIPKQQSLKSLHAREGLKKRELSTLLVEIHNGNNHYGEQYRNPFKKKKKKIGLPWDSKISLLGGHVFRENHPSKRHKHPNNVCGTIYNSQGMGTQKWPPTDEWMRICYTYPMD